MNWSEGLGTAILRIGQLSCQTAPLIVAVAAAQALFKSKLTPKVRYLLWMMVAIRLLLPVSLPGSFSFLHRDRIQILAGRWLSPSRTIKPLSYPTSFRFPNSIPSKQPTPKKLSSKALGWTWLAGFCIVAGYLMWRQRQLMRQVCHAVPVERPDILSQLEAVKKQFGYSGPISLVTTPAVQSPAVTGYIPKILIPEGWLERLSLGEWRYVFAHEIVHLKRKDLATNWALTALQIVHWFNPFVWWAFSRLRADRESVCDASVLRVLGREHRKAYSEILLRLAAGIEEAGARPALIALFDSRHDLEHRLHSIARFPGAKTHRCVSATLLLLTGLAGLMSVGFSTKRPAGLKIYGKVIDDRTQLPVRAFQITSIQNISTKPLITAEFVSTDNVRVTSSGEFNMMISPWSKYWAIDVKADGYQPFHSEAIEKTNTIRDIVIRMKSDDAQPRR